jgi:RimJ/RimL family protein N-acetyltransferase
LFGSTGLAFESADHAQTGYVLARDAWGKGYATEALSAMIEIAQGLRIRRLTALCHPEHRASQRVLEKCGFTRDASWSRRCEFPNLSPGVPQEVMCYERLLDGFRTHDPPPGEQAHHGLWCYRLEYARSDTTLPRRSSRTLAIA